MKRHLLKREITSVVVVKLILLAVLWYVCFSKPLASHLTRGDRATHLVSVTRGVE